MIIGVRLRAAAPAMKKSIMKSLFVLLLVFLVVSLLPSCAAKRTTKDWGKVRLTRETLQRQFLEILVRYMVRSCGIDCYRLWVAAWLLASGPSDRRQLREHVSACPCATMHVADVYSRQDTDICGRYSELQYEAHSPYLRSGIPPPIQNLNLLGEVHFSPRGSATLTSGIILLYGTIRQSPTITWTLGLVAIKSCRQLRALSPKLLLDF